MSANGLPCLDLLEATPGILRGLMSEVSDTKRAGSHPLTDSRSLKCWLISRTPKVIATVYASTGSWRKTVPSWSRTTRQMWTELYRNADPEEAFDHFEDQRETNLEFLRGLPPEAADRTALHREAGEITLKQMLHEWALHDLGHVRQIAELVRARKYLAGAGRSGDVLRIETLNDSTALIESIGHSNEHLYVSALLRSRRSPGDSSRPTERDVLGYPDPGDER